MIEKWEAKLRSFMPSWMSQDTSPRALAVISGLAAMMAAIEQDVNDVMDQAFIGKAVGEYLDLHGEDRNKPRLEGETDNAYRARIREIATSVYFAQLKAIVDGGLNNGESQLYEDDTLRTFANGEYFAGNNAFAAGERYANNFSVVVPKQILPPGVDDSTDLLNNIISIINGERAFGVSWDLREKTA